MIDEAINGGGDRDDAKPQVQYVPTATLLEPNNFIPSWEAGDEEKKEVSQTLRKLRIKYDNINKLVREKEHELEELKVKQASSYIFYL
jgi:hypothetical protein